jgi:hypothetical protein
MASVALRTPLYRVTLGSAHFNGKTVSCQTLAGLIALAEQRIGRPRRRVELLYPQLAHLQQEEARWRDPARQSQERAQHLEERMWELHFQIHATQPEVEWLDTQSAGHPSGPYSRLTQARRHLATYQRWQAAARRRYHQATQTAQRLLARAEAVRQRPQALAERMARYEADNRTNPQPLEVLFSLDGGFGTPDNVALLVELGYDVATKAHGRTATPQLIREVTARTTWETVNAITQATESRRTQLGRCPYPVRLVLTRQQRQDIVRHSTLVMAPLDAAWGRTPTLARCRMGPADSVHFYNRRQDIEGGIKEFKGVFYLGHMRFFVAEAIQIQEHLIAFLPNFIRWAIRYYFRPNAIYLPSRADRGLEQLKDVVRVAMHSQAEVRHAAGGCGITLAPKGAFAGLIIDLRQPIPFQPVLPLFDQLSIGEPTREV